SCALAALAATHTYDAKLRKDVGMPTIIHQRGSNYAHARNQLAGAGLQLGASHILFLDSDMTFPPDTLSRLLSHHKPIVGANYCRREEHNPSLLGSDLPNSPPMGVLKRMFHLPLGLMLIATSVLDKLEPPWFSYAESGKVSEDT